MAAEVSAATSSILSRARSTSRRAVGDVYSKVNGASAREDIPLIADVLLNTGAGTASTHPVRGLREKHEAVSAEDIESIEE